MVIFAAVLYCSVMKRLHNVVVIFLNVLFCAALLWFFTQNAYLRPYAGSTTKEIVAGLLLLVTLYANYLVLYPMLYNKFPVLYWISIVFISLITAGIELAVSSSAIAHRNTSLINEIGLFSYFFKPFFFVFGRNIAFNLVPYVIRNMQYLRKDVETKVQIIYQHNRLLDVCDDNNNCQYIPIDNILYFRKEGNYMYVHTTEGMVYTRYCSIKHLSQLLDNKEFIRISKSVIVPYQYIESYDDKQVVMKKMPCSEEPLTFRINPKKSNWISKLLAEHLQEPQAETDVEMKVDIEESKEETMQAQDKKPLSIPPQQKLDAVYAYLQSHPNSRSNEITSKIKYSQSTIERCLVELRKQGIIEYVGSKKTGGYRVVEKL